MKLRVLRVASALVSRLHHGYVAMISTWFVRSGVPTSARTGKSILIYRNCVKPRNQKYFAFNAGQITSLYRPVSPDKRGVSRIVTNARRDAVDADALLTRALKRTVKSCGPDAPTLASSLRSSSQAMVARKPGRQGEHEVNRKAIAQGMSDCLRCPVCSCAHLFVHIAHEIAGAARTRHSLRPCFRRGAKSWSNPDAWRRGSAIRMSDDLGRNCADEKSLAESEVRRGCGPPLMAHAARLQGDRVPAIAAVQNM